MVLSISAISQEQAEFLRKTIPAIPNDLHYLLDCDRLSPTQPLQPTRLAAVVVSGCQHCAAGGEFLLSFQPGYSKIGCCDSLVPLVEVARHGETGHLP
jgi:hypothetical protein